MFAVLKVAVLVFGLDTMTRLGATDWLLALAAITVVLASLIALRQDDLKRRLAYSTVSQLSYIVAGALLATPLGILGGALHITTHALGKITLFFCAGMVLVAAHRTRVSELDGLGRAMPWTFAAFFVASLSIIGLPPGGGLWSKWYLALGALEADRAYLVTVLMLSSLLNVAYLLPIVVRGILRVPQGRSPRGPGAAHQPGGPGPHRRGGDGAVPLPRLGAGSGEPRRSRGRRWLTSANTCSTGRATCAGLWECSTLRAGSSWCLTSSSTAMSGSPPRAGGASTAPTGSRPVWSWCCWPRRCARP